MEKLEEPIINRQIILGFIEKLEKFTPEERKEILKVIQMLNNPILIS